ncbi:MAG: PorP/SprF family type IX secretion system membrane protein [Bacteroidales bacterium]|nr:PorP/SprF family type IX secretion system membrane protein [Bacteroidales bacterium]
MKNIKTTILTIFIVMCISETLFAQDYIFSQTSTSQIYQNPAVAGNTDRLSATIIHRLQWPYENIATPATCLAIDFVPNIKNSGISLVALNGHDIGTKETVNQIGLSYSYSIQLSEKLIIKAGLRGGLYHRKLGKNLLYGDQYNENGTLTGNETEENISDKAIYKADFAVGALLSYKEISWIGISVAHVTRPNISLLLGSESTLPILWNINAGYIFYLNKTVKDRKSLTPTFSWYKQANFAQYSLGGYFFNKPLQLGLWYKGNPFDRYEGSTQNQAITIAVGLSFQQLNVEYSYDISLSKFQKSGGAHEFSITYKLPYEEKRGKVRSVSGPKW